MQGNLLFFALKDSLGMVCVRAAFHENDGNHENDENDEEDSDSYKQGFEGWNSRVQTTGSPNHGFRNTRSWGHFLTK